MPPTTDDPTDDPTHAVRGTGRRFALRTALVLGVVLAALELLPRLAADGRIPQLTGDEAQAVLASADRPAVLFFSIGGCHFCSGSLELLRDVATETGDEVRYVEVDHAEARTLATRYGVEGVPTLLVFDADHRLRGRAAAVSTRRELDRLLARPTAD